MTSEAELLRKARAEDPQALEELIEAQKGRIVNFVHSLCGDADFTEDVCQQVFLKAVTAIRDFRGDSAFSTWLYAIALNEVRRLSTREARARATGAEPAAARKHGVLTSLIRREFSAQLHSAVTRLPEPLRDCFVLRYLELLSYAEIARIVGASETAARVRAHRARQALRKELGDSADTALRRRKP